MFYKTTPDNREDYILEYQVHKKLNLGSIQPCEDGMGYSYDVCAHGAIHNETLAKSGCTTPFGPDKNHICTNLTVASQVFHISTKSSKHGPVAFSEMEILGFEVFGTFQLIFAH